jgi:hypothetical protein
MSLTLRAAPVAALLSTGCVLGPAVRVGGQVMEGAYCASPHALADVDPPPDADEAPAPEATARGFSRRSMDTARAIGAVVLLEHLAHVENEHAPEAQIIDARAQLIDAIQMATLDLASTSAELECEQERATQVATALRTAEAQQIRNITTDALVLTAVASVAAGVLSVAQKDDPVPAAVTGISGGVAGGVLGLATLGVHRRTRFLHPRNALGEVFSGAAHPDFPQSVWTYLTRAHFTATEQRPAREWLVLSWQKAGRLEQQTLVLGAGGDYDADSLENRAAMLDELEAGVSLMNHELQHLATEVSQK